MTIESDRATQRPSSFEYALPLFAIEDGHNQQSQQQASGKWPNKQTSKWLDEQNVVHLALYLLSQFYYQFSPMKLINRATIEANQEKATRIISKK